MKIEKISKQECRIIREKFDVKMAELQNDLGISISMGAIRYDTDGESACFKIEVKTLDAAPQMVKDYNAHVSICELPILGTKVKIGGRIFTTVGYKPRARKKPVIIKEISTGKEFVISEETLKRSIIS